MQKYKYKRPLITIMYPTGESKQHMQEMHTLQTQNGQAVKGQVGVWSEQHCHEEVRTGKHWSTVFKEGCLQPPPLLGSVGKEKWVNSHLSGQALTIGK